MAIDFTIDPSGKTRWAPENNLYPLCGERHLLPHKERLRLAGFTQRFSGLGDSLRLLSAMVVGWDAGAHPRRVETRGPQASWQSGNADGLHH